MTATEDRRGTSAHSPDLDWSQVRETVLMLELAVGQIESALKEGNSTVEVLTDSFTSMAGYMRMMGSALEQLPDTPATAQLKESLIGHAGEVAGRVQRSIVAFQFYDKLSQRLAHVSTAWKPSAASSPTSASSTTPSSGSRCRRRSAPSTPPARRSRCSTR